LPQQETCQGSVTSPSGTTAGKSKLDTLSKEDLIKFAKKQMALLQKVKSKCSGKLIWFCKRMTIFKLNEVRSGMKEQCLILKEQLKKTDDLEKALDLARAMHKEEVETLQNLLKETKAKEQNAELLNFEEANKEKDSELERLKEAHHLEVAESKKELERLQVEVERMKAAHEEELQELTEQMEASAVDFEMERERLLLLHDELTEQLALKETYLQDVEEEEEEPNRAREYNSSVFSGVSATMVSDDLQDEMMQLRLAFEDLQSQNIMLQEELTYLTNVKIKLESDLEQVKDEFQHEREDLEFKINELQMCKEDTENVFEGSSEKPLVSEEQWETVLSQHKIELQTLKELHKEEKAELEKSMLFLVEKAKEKNIQDIQELRVKCDKLFLERNLAVEEYDKTKAILQNLELELGNKTKDYNGMKEQGALAIDELQQKLRIAYKEKDLLQEEFNTLKLTLESSQEKASDAKDLITSLADLQRQNEEILTLLQQKENVVCELEDMLSVLSSQKQEVQEQLEKLRDGYSEERAKSAKLASSVESLSQNSEEMQQKLQELTDALVFAQAEKEKSKSQADTLMSRLAAAASERDQESSKLQALTEELTKLKEVGEALQEKINTHEAASAEERKEFQETLQSVSEERDSLKKEMEVQQHQLSQVRSYIFALLDQSNRDLERSTEDIPTLLENLQAQAEHNRQDVLQQSDARAAELVLAMEQNEQQKAELQAHVEDLIRERSLLKVNLDEVVADMEALQRDLTEMKAVNERVKAENQELLVQIAEVAEKLQSKENEPIQSERLSDEDASICEKEDLQQLLAEKEAHLLQLQQEIMLIKVGLSSPTKYNDLRSTQLTAKIAELQMENKEKEDKINKIKAVAVKAKKELDNSKKEVWSLRQEVEGLKAERDRVTSSMKDIIQGAEGYKNLLVEYDKQAEQLDQERARAEEAERQIGDLTKRLQAAIQQHEQLTSEREDMMAHMETLHKNVQQLEAQALEMQRLKSTLEKDLEAERLLKEQKAKDHSAVMKEADDLKAQLQKQKQQLQQTAQELEQLRKDAQQSTLMDMEMAHYERLVKELNQKLSEKDGRIEELASEIQAHKQAEEALHEEIGSLKSRVEQGEEKASKMKQLLVKTKKDLADAKQNMSIQASLRGELEAHQQQLEEYKIQCSEVTAERHRLQEQLKTVTEQQQRATSSFQHRVNTLQEECSAARAELTLVTSEFESYKVRVHNVLKQQKNKSSAQNESDFTKQEREHMESAMEQLRCRLQDTQQSLQVSCAELQQLQMEHDTLLERHNKMLQENVTKEAELRERLLSLQSEHMALKSEHSQTVSQLSAQADTLRASFREQVRHLQEEHRSTVETLQQQMSKLESQLFQQQREPSVMSPAPAQLAKKTTQDRKAAEMALLDLQSMAREEGEGMETTETESVSSAGTPQPSLEQLLTSPDPKQEPFTWQVEPSKEELAQKLSTATRSMEHMNGLLHETEATNAILMEQITLLKSEVRRLERNQEREKSVANLEYLKNVLLQFIFLKSGSERQALLPVIHTMLQLSPEEKSKLAAIAQGTLCLPAFAPPSLRWAFT
uniref:GRIP and coiled-coil domain containing 2 n=1 Tax=Scleropages formosus TaxID=113540 RepID=A0A8C9TNK8_SCLFO